jgi:hypothetical protein
MWKITFVGVLSHLYQDYFGRFPMVLGDVSGCVTGVLECFWADDLMVRPVCGAFFIGN